LLKGGPGPPGSLEVLHVRKKRGGGEAQGVFKPRRGKNKKKKKDVLPSRPDAQLRAWGGTQGEGKRGG